MLLNVFASWCGPRREGAPACHPARQAPPAGRVCGPQLQGRAHRRHALAARAGQPYSAVVVDADGRVGIDYGVYGVPETFVIGADGSVAFKHVGPLTPEVIAQRIEPLLK